jgi:transcriptional regulator with XRE-family HTH domain
VNETGTVQRNIEQQREWYGEPLGNRVRRLVVAFDVSQANLAEVLGISAPMLSQVMSGRRAKIGNPAVLARLLMLERKVLTPQVASGEPEELRRALEEVRDSRPSVTVDNVPVESGDAHAAISFLRHLADPPDLAEVAGMLDARFPEIAVLFRRASRSRSRGR